MSVSRCAGWLLAGRYRLLSELGHGGMGRVWRAHDELLDRQVAVKEVTLDHPPGAERERLLGRTMREARLAARLSHPHIAAVYDVVVADERPWIVLQLVPARNLADVIAERGPLPVAEAARVGLQVLQALRAAHADGIVHRDVKPGNILLNGDRHALLTDFGLATTLDDEAHLTQSGMVVGTPAYIAPERLRGGPATPKADLWSLGATLYAAVEGHSPFPHSGQVAALTAVLTASPAPFQQAGPLAPVIAGLLEKDPARRMDAPEAHRRLTRLASPPDTPPADTAATPIPTGAPLPPPGTATPIRTGYPFPSPGAAVPIRPGDRLPSPGGAAALVTGTGTGTVAASFPRTGDRFPPPRAADGRGGVRGTGRGFAAHRQLAPFSDGVPQLVLPPRWRQMAALAALIVSVLVTTSWSAEEPARPRTPGYAEPATQQAPEHAGVMHAVAASRARPSATGTRRPPAAGGTTATTSGKSGKTALKPIKGKHKGLTRGKGHTNGHGKH
ncbi:MAG: protein kinase [Nonomuraea sp.]|nr:protein kinase [Nonomuraea sp.]